MTKKKQLTFEQISPNWAKALRSNPRTEAIKDKKGQIHLLSDYACCIVGESHGFKSDYCLGDGDGKGQCRVCLRISEEFDCAITNRPPSDYTHVNRKRSLNSIKKEFVVHWNKKHI